MCWTLLPQSLCINCGFPVHFPQIQDPCHAVVSNGLPFATCGDSPWMAIQGPEDVTCYDCLVLDFPQEPIPENVRRRSDRVYRIPRASFQPLYDPSPAVPGFPALMEAPPRPSSSNLRRPPPAFGAGVPTNTLSINNYPAAGNPAPVSGRPSTSSAGRWPARPRGGRGGPSRMRYGLQPSPQVTNPAGQGAMALATTSSVPAAAPVAPRGRGRVTYAAPMPRGNHTQQVPTRAVTRPHTPMPAPRRIQPTTAQTEDDDYDEEEYYSSEDYASATNPSSSAYFSDWSSSNPHSGQRLTLPGADSPFGWGHTAPRRNPTTTPVVASFLSDYLASPTTYAPPASARLPPAPIPNAQPNDAAWIPSSWGEAAEMPADLAHTLNVTTADCVFRQHRVYFVPDLWETDGEGDTVLVVTPCGTRVRVLSYLLYVSTSASVNQRAREAELAPVQDDDEALETPSTLHLSPVKTANRAPRKLVEKDGEVKSRPFKDLTMHSDGSPSPPQQRRSIQSAEDEAATENATQNTTATVGSAPQEGSQGAPVAGSSRAAQSEGHRSSKARAKLGAKFDMSDLRIGEDDDEIF
ncbi:hypothetical protein K4K59_007363 [Colletotrichum sp. SAR11_240]|nr:hypothetical protein K4K59_007363 [Colletotrichum sp. SAR11_240]